MEVNGIALVFGIAYIMSGLLMTFYPQMFYDWETKLFFTRSTVLKIVKVLGPLTLLAGIVLFIASLTRII
jgi:hypothetical protein